MARNRNSHAHPRVTIADPDIVVEVQARPEDLPIKGNALASGNDLQDRQEEERIARDLAAGNPWAWCTAFVRVTYRGEIHADDYLGACSYQSEEEFRKDPYCSDMIANCLDRINISLAIVCGPPKGGK